LNGVFTVLARLQNGDYWPGVANIGLRPTVDGVLPALEVHLHGFREEIYAQPLEVFFLAKLRNEKKFNGLEELKENIARDIDHSIQFFNQAHPDWVPGSAWPDREIQPLLATAPLTFPANQP
jgi:riboflavin kinase/FMN adenylyltransferase